MNRREFLAACATAALAKTGRARGRNPLNRIAVLSWSFRDAFPSTRAKGGWVPEKDLDILDYPQMIADTFHIHNVEVQTMYLKKEPSFIKEFKVRLKRAKSRLVNIPAEPSSEIIKGIGSPDEQARAKAIEAYVEWIDYAAEIGSPTLMINQGNLYDDLGPLTDSAKRLVEHGRTRKVVVTAEPRGTSGRRPELLAKVLRESGMRSTTDIGNFSDDVRERGIRELLPLMANTCHVKYNPARFDLAHLLQIIQDSGYKGLFTIEAAFGGSPYEQTQRVLDQLVKYV